MQVKISVVMGVYNPDGEQLERSVKSIISQSMREWELLLYDDGSDIPFAEAVRGAAALDKRIIYIRNKKNNGLAYALNQCVRRARGEYIARMDCDDESKPERLRRQYEFLEGHSEYGWAGSNAELFDENGVWGIQTVSEIPEEKDFLRFSPYIHPSVMFRREVLTKNYGYIPAKVTRRCEDYELFMRLHVRGCRGYNLQENLVLYREDKNAYERRRFVYRFNEMLIRYRGFKRMGILRPATAACVFRPLAGGLIPVSFVRYIHRKKEGVKNAGQDPKIHRIPEEAGDNRA